MEPARSVRRPWTLTLFASLAAAIVATLWLAVPDTYPYGSGDNVTVGVNHLIERVPAVTLLLPFAAMGILLAFVALRRGASRTALRVAGIGAMVETLFFAFVMADGAILASLGYLTALAAPVGVAAIVVLACRRSRRAGLVLALLVLVLAVAGFASGALITVGEAAVTYLGSFTRDPEGYYVRIAWSWGMVTVAACWAWAAVETLLSVHSGGRPEDASAPRATPASARRWGRAVTIAAALGPVPYGLARLTWLTPWPLGGPGVDELVISRSLDAATRLQGSLFALPCALGVILTLGLISRWGEVFPRWVPVLGGRSVPAKLAIIPGTIVAAVLIVSAPGILVDPIESGDLREVVYVLVGFPLPVWGPLLAAAVCAYWLRRRAAANS